MRERLKHFAQSSGVQEPIRVHVPLAEKPVDS
jgi:hypothetical protein